MYNQPNINSNANLRSAQDILLKTRIPLKRTVTQRQNADRKQREEYESSDSEAERQRGKGDDDDSEGAETHFEGRNE